MTDAYERGYRKIARLEDLSPGQPSLYRTGGSIILLLRDGQSVRAADATTCAGVERSRGTRERLQAVAECLGDGSALEVDWGRLVDDHPLPAEVREEEVWVCVDLCAS